MVGFSFLASFVRSLSRLSLAASRLGLVVPLADVKCFIHGGRERESWAVYVGGWPCAEFSNGRSDRQAGRPDGRTKNLIQINGTRAGQWLVGKRERVRGERIKKIVKGWKERERMGQQRGERNRSKAHISCMVERFVSFNLLYLVQQ